MVEWYRGTRLTYPANPLPDGGASPDVKSAGMLATAVQLIAQLESIRRGKCLQE